jgi:hypothetical protein
MNSSLPTKTVLFSQTKHLQWLLFLMLLKASALCGSNPSALLAAMACARDVQRNFSSGTG